MLNTTIAFENFLVFHMPTRGDCKVLRRIECAVRGEELYRTFESAPPRVSKLLFAVFNYHAWTALCKRDHDEMPREVQERYELAMSAIRDTHSDVAINSFVAFADFARKYVDALAMLKSDYFRTLPEESTNAIVRTVCSYYHNCQTDVFPGFTRDRTKLVFTTNLPSYCARLPKDLPEYLRGPTDPLLILYNTASVLLSV